MANYCCAIRTNYFRVKDPEEFREFMKTVSACEDNVALWEETDSNGVLRFGFGCYSSILGVPALDEEDEDYEYYEYDYDEFVTGLSERVAEDDAIIIMESGNEKLRYVIGTALVITSKETEYFDVSVVAANRAAEVLGNPDWQTRVSY